MIDLLFLFAHLFCAITTAGWSLGYIFGYVKIAKRK
jgi:hypothetical protein